MSCNVLQTHAVSSSRKAFSTSLGGASEVQTSSPNRIWHADATRLHAL